MEITREFYDYVSSIKPNPVQYKFRCEKYSPIHKCNRLMKQISEVENRIEYLTNKSKQSSSFNDTHLKISSLSMDIKKSLIDIQNEIQEIKDNDLKNNVTNKYYKVFLGNSIDTLTNNANDLATKFQKFLQLQATTIKKIEQRKSKLSLSSRNTNKINSYNEYASDLSGTNYNTEEDILLTVGGQQKQINNNSQYYQKRLNDVLNIERLMSDISELMHTFSININRQGEMIENISRNTDISLENVEKGEKEVKTILESVKSHRWLLIRIFLILICFSVFYIIFLS